MNYTNKDSGGEKKNWTYYDVVNEVFEIELEKSIFKSDKFVEK